MDRTSSSDSTTIVPHHLQANNMYGQSNHAPELLAASPPPPHQETTSVQDSAPSLISSDSWFARQAAKFDVSGRRLVGNAQIGSGLLNWTLGLLGWAEKIGLTDTFAFGLNSITDGFRTRKETDIIRSKTGVEALDHANQNKLLAVLSILPATGIAIALSGSLVIGFSLGILGGILRYTMADRVKRQIEFLAAQNDEQRSLLASESWFQNKTLREIPTSVRLFERASEYVKTLIYGGFAIWTLLSDPLLSVILGLSSVYSFWKAHKSLPPVIDYYRELSQEVEARIPITQTQPATSTAEHSAAGTNHPRRQGNQLNPNNRPALSPV